MDGDVFPRIANQPEQAMSNLKRPPAQDEEIEPTSSPGNQSKSVTPKDVSPHDAAARDVKERKTCSDDPEEKEEELLDDAVELTFPASDPIACTVSDKELQRRRAELRQQQQHR